MAGAPPSSLSVDEALARSIRDPRLMQAGLALVEGQLAVAERLLRPRRA